MLFLFLIFAEEGQGQDERAPIPAPGRRLSPPPQHPPRRQRHNHHPADRLFPGLPKVARARAVGRDGGREPKGPAGSQPEQHWEHEEPGGPCRGVVQHHNHVPSVPAANPSAEHADFNPAVRNPPAPAAAAPPVPISPAATPAVPIPGTAQAAFPAVPIPDN